MSPEPPPGLLALFPDSVRVGEALRNAGLSVAVAESCTGGLLGAVLSAVPGASRYLRGGVIAYADRVKLELLEVPGELLLRQGAVSAEVARLMAEGVRRCCGADVGLAVTGIAGPGGGEGRKPVGLIHLAVRGPGATAAGRRLMGDHGREENRHRAVGAALELCLEALARAGGS